MFNVENKKVEAQRTIEAYISTFKLLSYSARSSGNDKSGDI